MVFPVWKQGLERFKLPGSSIANRYRHQEEQSFCFIMCKRKVWCLETHRSKARLNQAVICLQNYITPATTRELTVRERRLFQYEEGWLIQNEMGFVSTCTVLRACRVSSSHEEPLGQGCSSSGVEPVCRQYPWGSSSSNAMGFSSPMQPLRKLLLPLFHLFRCTREIILQVGVAGGFSQKSAFWVVSSARCWWWHVGLPAAPVLKSLGNVKPLRGS